MKGLIVDGLELINNARYLLPIAEFRFLSSLAVSQRLF